MQSALRLCACAAIGLAMAGSIAFAAEYNLRAGMSISQVRGLLLKEGWTPVRVNKKTGKDTAGNQEGDGRALFAAGYFEVEMCNGTGIGYCIFNYQKNGQCLRITTMGEYFSPQEEPHLLIWDNNCPD